MVTLKRAPETHVGPASGPHVQPTLFQMAAIESDRRVLRVLGGPGTGKSTVAVEAVAAAALRDGARADRCLVLAPTRQAAATLRDAVTSRVATTSTQPLARTWQALGFAILRAEAALAGEPAPRLLSGPEQDVVLRDLLAGHASGEVPAPPWPSQLREALGTRGFRNELRDLLMRAVESGLGPRELRELGERTERPEWVAAAQVLGEYDAVTALSGSAAFDPAWVLTATTDLLEDEPDALARVAAQVELIVVDDAQEMTRPAARLLGVLARTGARVVLLGDPDAAVQTFRGADPTFLASQWQSLAPQDQCETVVLAESFRTPRAVAQVRDTLVRRIGALGGGRQRGATPTDVDGRVEVALLRSQAQEAGHIAARLRREHLLGGMDWSDMAVLVRGAGRASTLRRLLAQGGVPVAAPATEVPVRDEPAVAPLLLMLREVLASVEAEGRGEAYRMDPAVAADLLTSTVGGSDSVALRRLRRELRRGELEAGGARTSDELLADVLAAPVLADSLGPVARSATRVARALAAGAAAARRADDGSGWASGVTAESVLWAIWSGLGVAEQWRRTALGGGPGSARADRDLDAVLAMFDAASAFVDRLPGAGPDAFLAHVTGQDVPGDTLVARAQTGSAVELLTPQSAAGRQWRLVVVAGVQEGVWPDLRLRGSVLGSEALVDAVEQRPSDTRAAQAAVRYDETRSFHVAVTRTSEQLLVTACSTEQEQPSVYLDLVDPPPVGPDGVPLDRPLTEAARPMTLTGLVGQLRRTLVTGTQPERERAARMLAHAAQAGVTGADPQTWWALRELSTDRPLRGPDEQVAVSPSKVERFGTCPLNWFLASVGGQGQPMGAATLGTLVHAIVAETPDAAPEELHAELERRWPLLGLSPGWITDRTRREAREMVQRYVQYRDEADARGWSREGVEVPFRAQVGRALVTGQVDRLERDADGRLVVVDFKTGSTKPTQAQVSVHPQLAAYQVAVEHGAFGEANTSGGAALVHLGRAAERSGPPAAGVHHQPPVSEAADPGWAASLVQETAEGMGASTFRAVIGDSCTICPLKSSCPVQPEGSTL